TNTYDIAGNAVSTTDGNNKTTSLTFSAPDFAFRKGVSKVIGGKTLQWTTAYDFSTGQVTSFTDPNNNITSYSAVPFGGSAPDPLARPTLVPRPDNGRTQFSYDDTSRVITTTSDQISQDGKLISQVVFDGLGRQKQTRTFEDGNSS